VGMNEGRDIWILNEGVKDVITAACKKMLPYCEDPWDSDSLQPMFPLLAPPSQLSILDRFLGDLARVASWMGWFWATFGYVAARRASKTGHHFCWLVAKVDIRAWTRLFLWCKSSFNFSGNEWETFRKEGVKEGKPILRCGGIEFGVVWNVLKSVVPW
jgi:hypothetical protein